MNSKTIDLEKLSTTTDLGYIMSVADVEDLDTLVDYITDSGAGRLALDSTVCKLLVGAKERGDYTDGERALIAQEILEFGGNSLGNALRKARGMLSGSFLDKVLPDADATVCYEEIVKDVASHLDVKMPGIAAISDVEIFLMKKILGKAVEKMTEEEKQAIAKELGLGKIPAGPGGLALLLQGARLGGFATYKVAVIVANAVSKAILGKGLKFGAAAVMNKGLSMALGPIGWAVTALWTLSDLASPAYRVTVPAVIHVAYIRNKLIARESYTRCGACDETYERQVRFCPHCAAPNDAVA